MPLSALSKIVNVYDPNGKTDHVWVCVEFAAGVRTGPLKMRVSPCLISHSVCSGKESYLTTTFTLAVVGASIGEVVGLVVGLDVGFVDTVGEDVGLDVVGDVVGLLVGLLVGVAVVGEVVGAQVSGSREKYTTWP